MEKWCVVILLLLLGCRENEPVQQEFKIEGFAQGTTYHITYVSTSSVNYERSIDSILIRIDNSLSTYQKKSVISKVNRADSITQVDQYFKDVFKASKDVYNKTSGAFNPTIGSIVNAWGFGPEKEQYPDSSVIESLIQSTTMNDLILKDDFLIKLKRNIKLDFNAIAQGYSVDVLCDFLEEKGIKNYMVEVGGELKTSGKNIKGNLWRIGIDKPLENMDKREIALIINLDNKSLATSGNYRKVKNKKGFKYSHTINPKTGYPVITNLLSATVVTDNCTEADAFATAFMVLGLEKSIELLKSLKKLEGILIYENEKGDMDTFITEKLKKHTTKPQ